MIRVLLLLGLLILGGSPAHAANELRVLAPTRGLSPELVARFTRETSITVTVEEVPDSTTMMVRLDQNRAGYDIALPADHQVAPLIEGGRLERIWADRLPGFWNIEDPWRSRSFDPRNEYTVPHQWGTVAFAIDTAIHRGDIDTLRLLLEPPAELSGRIGAMDQADMVQLALLYLGEPRCVTDSQRLERAARLLRGVVPRMQILPARRMTQELAEGRLVMAVVRSGDAWRARETRASLAYAYPKEGNLIWTDVLAIPSNPPNKSNALKFLAFMLRPENAALQSNHNGFANMIRGSESHMQHAVLVAPELVAPWPAKVGFMVSCGAEVQRRHELLWSELKKSGS